MIGYSKIKIKSRTMDFTDLLSPPTFTFTSSSTKTKPNTTNYTTIKTQETINRSGGDMEEEESEDPINNNNGEIIMNKAVLRRNCSVSSSTASSTNTNSSSGLQSAVKRAFSMRRSSSVSERYSRIHHQSLTLSPCHDDDVDDITRSGKKKNKKKSSFGIFKTCKKLFSF